MKSTVLSLVLVAICLTVQGQVNDETPTLPQWEYIVPTARAANKTAPRVSVRPESSLHRKPLTNKPLILARIVRGNDAKIEEYPYQLQLGKNGKRNCGAVIISKAWAVTVAHCMFNKGIRVPVRSITVRAGSTLLNRAGTVHGVNKTVIHELFIPEPYRPSGTKSEYDIALLKVSQPFVFNKKVQPIALPFQGQEFSDGKMAVVTGWGRTMRLGTSSPRLQFAMVPVVNQAKCYKAYPRILTSKMICAGAPNRGSCRGDSGGALAVNGILAGLIAFSTNCNQPGSPGVSIKVSAYRDYIRRHTGV